MNISFLEQNFFQIAVILSIFILFLLTITAAVCYKSATKTHKIKSLEQNLSEKELSQALLSARFADIESLLAKTEQKNTDLSNALNASTKQLAALTAATKAKEESLNEKITFLEKIKEDLTLKFKNISQEIADTQRQTASKEQKEALSTVITPFAEQLKAFKAEVVAAREESVKTKSSLDTQLINLSNLNLALSKDAQNLADALKGSKKAQGCWGECRLGRILEISGLVLGQDYDTEETFKNEDKKIYRPDVIVHLPENRDIIIDSKVSLNDYLEAVNAEDDDNRQKALQKNTAAIKAHIDELSAKEYQNLLKDRTLNYVIMFIPVESAYIAALEYDHALYDYAYKKNIILATPLSLLPTLRTVENLWRIDSQNRNVQKIAELGGKIYDKLADFVNDMKSLERGLNQANGAYAKAMTKLQGRGGALSQAEKMRLLGAKTNKLVNLSLNDNDIQSLETPDNDLPALEILGD